MILRIVTHEYPDLDAIFSIWLLKKFGNKTYPGIEKAELKFVPAANKFDPDLPLNQEAIAVDILGGQFDHHGERKAEKCSAVIVADHLGVNADPSLNKMLRVINQHDLTGRSFGTKVDPSLSLFTLFEMIRGWHALNDGDHELTVMQVSECLDAMHASEIDWLQAVDDCRSAIIHQGTVVKILAATSSAKSAMKAGRSAKATIVIIANPCGNVGITATKNENWKEPDLTDLAAVLRLASCLATRSSYLENDLFSDGLYHGWFLHPSKEILNHGSDRSMTKEPCPLNLEEVAALTANVFNLAVNVPQRLTELRSIWLQIKKNRR